MSEGTAHSGSILKHTLGSPWASVRDIDIIPLRKSVSSMVVMCKPAARLSVVGARSIAGGGTGSIFISDPPHQGPTIQARSHHHHRLAKMRVCVVVLLLSVDARGLVAKAGSKSPSERLHLPKQGALADVALAPGLYCRGGSSAARGAGAAGLLGKKSAGKGGLPAVVADTDKPWGAKQGWGQLRRSPEARTSSSTELVSPRGACASLLAVSAAVYYLPHRPLPLNSLCTEFSTSQWCFLPKSVRDSRRGALALLLLLPAVFKKAQSAFFCPELPEPARRTRRVCVLITRKMAAGHDGFFAGGAIGCALGLTSKALHVRARSPAMSTIKKKLAVKPSAHV